MFLKLWQWLGYSGRARQKEVNDVKGAIDFENVSLPMKERRKGIKSCKPQGKSREYVALVGSSTAQEKLHFAV